MDFEYSFLRFLGFLGIEIGFILASVLTVIPLGILVLNSSKVKGWYLTLTGIIAETMGVIFIFLCIWVLTGTAYTTLLGILILVPIIAILGTELVWLIIGSPNVKYPGRILWSQHEFQSMWPKTYGTIQLFGVLPFIVYSIYIGLEYFGEAPEAGQWTKFVFEATMLTLIGGAWLVLLPKNIYTITSENILGPTRTRIFINQLAASAPMMLYMSLFLWATTDIGTHTEPLGSIFVVSRSLSIFIVAYVVLFIVLPFTIGHYRSKHQVLKLQKVRDKRIEEILAAIGSPGVDQVEQKLMVLETELREDIESLNNDPHIQLAHDVLDSDENDYKNLLPKISLRDSLDRDPRFIHIIAMEELSSYLSELKTAIKSLSSTDEKREALNVTTTRLQQIRDKNYVNDSSTSTWAIGIISSAGTAILSPIWSTVTQHLLGLLGIEA